MSKKLHFKSLLLLCAMIMGSLGVWAEDVTLTLTQSNLGLTGSYTSGTEKTIDGITFVYTDLMKNSENIQAKASSGVIYNQTAFSGDIKSVAITHSGTARATTIYGSSDGDNWTQIATGSGSITGDFTNKAYKYFKITRGSNAAYWTKIEITYTGGGAQIPTCATPTFDPNPATAVYTSAQNVTISTETSDATIYYTTDGTTPTTSSSVYSSAITVSETTTIKAMAVKEGMNNSTIATATYTIKLPYSGDGYVRIYSLDDLTDGAKVIIAARYNTTANAYYAMTAAASGKPTGVSFTSTTTSKGEELPTTILNDENTYYWTVNVTSNGYTFTNASGKKLGYSSSTNFAESGNNTAWTITRETSIASAMVSGYEGFYITNQIKTDRGIALNQNNDFGPYDTSNNKSNLFNFYLDIFVEGARPVPSISANNVNIAYDAIEGSISYTLNNGVEGGVVTVNTEADWLTLGTVSETVPFTCTANTETTERTATVTLTYTYGDNETVTKDVTVTQAAAPILYTTIPAIFNAATSTATDVNVTFGNWVVSGVKGSNAYVTDNNGNGFIIYKSDHGFAVNDKLSGTVTGTPLQLYKGAAEFTNLTNSTEGLTVSHDGAITVITDKTIADLGGVNTGAVITLSNLTYDGTNLSDGTNTTIKPFNSLYSDMSFTSGKTYNVTGVYVQYDNTKEILPRSAEDIEEVEVEHEQYTLTVSDLVNVNTFVFDASDQTEMLLEGNGSIDVYDGTSVLISIDLAQGYVLESLIVDGQNVTSQIDETGAYTFTMPTRPVTVTATAVEATTYTLATSITSGKHYVIAATTSTTTKAMGGKNASKDYYDAVDASLSENTITVADNSGVQEFVIYGPNAYGYYTIYDPVAGGYLYASSSSSNDLSCQATNDANGLWEIDFTNETVTAKGSNTRNLLRYNSSSPRFSCYASGQTAIYFYEKDGETTPTETVHVTSAKYATYCSENALDFDGTGLTAYIAIMDGSEVSFEEVTSVPAYTGVLLKANAAGDFTVNVATTVDDVTGNAFIGVTKETSEEAGIFVLMNTTEYGVGFYKAENAFTVGAHTAYLPALPSASRNFIAIDEATAIKTIETAKMSSEIYNLAGQRVKSAQKGLYIIDGKKVVIK